MSFPRRCSLCQPQDAPNRDTFNRTRDTWPKTWPKTRTYARTHPRMHAWIPMGHISGLPEVSDFCRMSFPRRCSLCQPQDAPGAAAAMPFALGTCSVKARRDTYPKTSRCAPMSHRCASFFRFMRRAKMEATFSRNCVDVRNRFPQKNAFLRWA